jgi:uncharacterized membrane protein
MDELIFFGLLALAAVILGIVLPIVALTKVGNLRWELNKVKAELDNLQSHVFGGSAPKKSTAKSPEKSAEESKAVPATDSERSTGRYQKVPTRRPEKTSTKVAAAPSKAAPLVSSRVIPKGPSFFDRMVENFKANWIVWLAALSLAFGGVFIVQFGIERGMLGPRARVALAIAFGLALIAGAEFLRKKSKDQKVALFSPVTALAAGGIASLFGAVVSAHVLYDLTSPMVGFISMAVVAWAAMALAMIYGPVLAVIGILGAYFSPILVSSGQGAEMMYLYYLLVLAASLFVERWQRWIWLSSLSVGCALFLGWAMHYDMTKLALSGPYFAAVALLAITIPAFGVLPKATETAWLDRNALKKISHQYPTILAVGTGIAITALMFIYAHSGLIHWQIGLLLMLGLTAGSILLCRRAQNLDQLTAIFGLGTIAILGQVAFALLKYNQGLSNGAVSSVVSYFPTATISMLGLLALGVGASLWRAGKSVRPSYWHILTVALPLIGYCAYYVGWEHSAVRGSAFWTGSSIALAAYFTGLAGIMIRRGQKMGADILGTGAVVAWGMAAYIGMAYNDPWLTVVIAALAGISYLCVARYDLRLVAMASVIVTGVAISRLVVDPGWLWAANTLVMPFLIAFVGTIAVFGACLRDATARKRPMQVVQFETAGLAALATFLCVWLVRWSADIQDHMIAGIYATLLGVLAMVQYYRRDQLAEFKGLRNAFGLVLSLVAGLMLAAAVGIFTPLFTGKVAGFFPLDSVVLAYVLPALLLFASVYFKVVPYLLPKLFTMVGATVLGAYALVLEIRHFWHGSRVHLSEGVYQNELYTYTIVMLIATVAVFVASVKQNSLLLRRIGLALAAATALKVFLWDISELRGLGRATSFIGLGLTLAALGWLHQTYAITSDDDSNETDS